MNAFRTASAGQLAGVLRVSDEKLVSSDYLSSTESSIIDADATVMLDEHTAKIVAWYDNEYGFASRSKSLRAVSLLGLPLTSSVCDLVVHMRTVSIKNRAGENVI
jgi:glyceraldehyde-3-phosphate dehydrogenase/erythrose-4-phosphate dehydrogenase